MVVVILIWVLVTVVTSYQMFDALSLYAHERA